MQKDSARFSLKADTAQLHKRLHELPVFQKLVNGTLQPAGYLALMIEFREFYARADVDIADACERYKKCLGDYEYFPRSKLITSDVTALESYGIQLRQAPQTTDRRLKIGGLEELIGVLYVVDGAALGGSALNKPVELLLQDTGADGASYWRWCQTNGVPRWKSTLQLLEWCWQATENHGGIVSSARQTFEVLGSYLGAQGHPQERTC